MPAAETTDIDQFFITGINYKKTDASVRGMFAIGTSQYHSLLNTSPSFGIKELFVLSTCNRTEVYGIANSAEDLVQLLCRETTGDAETFKELSYTKRGWEAVEHLFCIAAGLDSQILGDYEIVGQIKQAIKFSKEHGSTGAFLERLVNSVLQSSKAIKTQTELSGGTVSVSFAAIQFLKTQVKNINEKKILLVGLGKIGNNTCKNMVDYLHTKNITLINRTDGKAFELATAMQLQHAPYDSLREQVQIADIVLVATNAEAPVIYANELKRGSDKILIDLSIPNNIEASAKELPNITLINVDDLSKLKDETLQKREAEIPKVKNIISLHLQEFMEWYGLRRNVPILKAVKKKLADMQNCGLYKATHTNPVPEKNIASDNIQKVINTMAVKLRGHNTLGCHYIEAINEYITVGADS